ncbi:MAG: CPBP family intramembrane metalloprotease [Comamonadaceae bacterium]|nr:MAG: CPBP family intramembrane metalloprotease [Comamonadaceae bacterium]
MRLQPRWWIGVAVFLAYAVWIVAVWKFFDVDYASIGQEASLLRAVVLPLGIAAIALALFNWRAGWWPQTIREPRLHQPLYLAVLLFAMLGFIGINLYATGWASISPRHILVLAGAMLLVGFCEEMVTRGVLLVALRGSLRSEAWVWFASTGLFGLLHATNAFFGLGAFALVQVLLAFCAGTGLYLVRRLTGSIWPAMLLHALWDFSSIAHGLGQAPSSPSSWMFLVSIYGVSLVLVFLVLRRARA